MADHYGSLRGALLQSTPIKYPVGALGGEFIKRKCIDTIELAATPATDRIFLGTFGLESILDPDGCSLYYDALGAGVTLSVGNTTYPVALAAAAAASSAASRSAMASVDIASYGAPLWKVLGYADLKTAQADNNNGVTTDLYATIGTAAATGTLTWQFKVCDA